MHERARTHVSARLIPPGSNLSPPQTPVAPHFTGAAPLFCPSRCVAVATGPFHLPIPSWVCIFRLSPQASQSHFGLISPSDWFVPLMPSFKVLTFIHSRLPNDNEEENHLSHLCLWPGDSERTEGEEWWGATPVA